MVTCDSMGRPQKRGLYYFSCDVDFYSDTKLRRLFRTKGNGALSVYHCMLCNVYREGYYLEWDDDLYFIIAEQIGLDENYVSDTINYCLEIGLFDKTMYEKHRVITSRSIQERYEKIIKESKRKVWMDKYFLLQNEGVSSEENVVSSEETIVNSEETTQNESKEDVSSEESAQIKINKINILLSNDSVQKSESALPKRVKSDYALVVKLWHEICTSYPRITKLTEKRRQKIDQRMKELNMDYGQLESIFHKMQNSSFMKNGSWATFDWVFASEGNMTKVIEGNYDDKKSSTRQNQDFSMNVNEYWNNIDFDPSKL